MPSEKLNAVLFTELNLIADILISSAFDDGLPIEQVREIVKPEDFTDLDYSRIYQAMLLCESPPQVTNTMRSLYDNKLLRDGDLQRLELAIAHCECSLDYLYNAKNVKHYGTIKNQNNKPNIKGAIL